MSGTETLRNLVDAVEQVLIGKHAGAELAFIGLSAAGQGQRVPAGKVGRNDPCPCGSGKKFKRCHGA